MVLNHRWVSCGGPRTLLETPRVIRRNNSAKDLAAFAESANAMKRLVLRHQTYSTDFTPFKSRLSSHRENEEMEPMAQSFNIPITPNSESSLSPPQLLTALSEKCLMTMVSPVVDPKFAQARAVRTTLSLDRRFFGEPELIGF